LNPRFNRSSGVAGGLNESVARTSAGTESTAKTSSIATARRRPLVP